MPESSLPDHLVLYDGVCALCNGTVRFLIGLDEDRILHFAPLQGSTAENLLREHGVDLQMKSMVFADRDPGGGPHRLYFRSDAILHIFRRIGGLWSVLAWTRFLPRFIRDTVYDVIAGNRYRWFGKSEACFLPPPEARERFLD